MFPLKKMFDWDTVRRSNGTIDLVKAYRLFRGTPDGQTTPRRVLGYIALIESVQQINSRQVGAVVLANAVAFEGEV